MNNKGEYYAHTKENDPNQEHWQSLKEHQSSSCDFAETSPENTANLAKKFSEMKPQKQIGAQGARQTATFMRQCGINSARIRDVRNIEFSLNLC